MSILTEPKNALVKQYGKQLAMNGVKLRVTRDALRALAEEAVRRLRGIPGLLAVDIDTERGGQELQVQIDRDRSRRLGIDPRAVSSGIGYTMRGQEVGRFPGADGRDLGPETLADLRHLPRNIGEAVPQGPQVERRSPDEQDPPAARPDAGDRRGHIGEPAGDVVRLRRGDDVDEVVRHLPPFSRPRLGGADVEPAVDRHRVDTDDLRP